MTRPEQSVYDELVESETRFRIMADSAPVLLWMSGIDSECTFFNQTWLTFTGRAMEQEVGTGWIEGVHPEDLQECMEGYLSAFVERQPFRLEYRLRRADGAYRWILDQGVPRFAPGGAFAGYIGSCVDITELRAIAEAERETTRRLELVVKEIHHRVKNKLQIISSIINLQTRQMSDPRSLDVFRETQTRIRAIALLHERLYQSNDLVNVDAAEYLNGVVAGLRSSIGAAVPSAHIDVVADDVRLAMDTAVPCGLIVNELVTNALKYAFDPDAVARPHGRAGVQNGKRPEPLVNVRLARRPEGGLVLGVADNGVGLGPTADAVGAKKKLGLELVHLLARQLHAEVSVSTDEGTHWTIMIPDEGLDGEVAREH